MRLLMLGMASAMLLSACEAITSRDETDPSRLEAWRARLLLGGGDGEEFQRREGRVVSGEMVEAGSGTIFPGRTPLVRDGDFGDGRGPGTVSLNLVDVTIEEAASAILGDLLNVNYVLDPQVQGTVNIRSTQPVSPTTAIEVFEIALRQNGAVLVRRGETFAIVPLTADLRVGASTGREIPIGYSIRVVPLRNIGAQEMATILQPFAGEGIVGIDTQRNIVVLAGTSADQRAWQNTIRSFDVDWLANRSVGIFPVRGKSAQSIISGLDLIVETEEGAEPLVAFEVIPEVNSILAVAKTPSALKNVAVWIQRLTRETANDTDIYSYDMRFARASDIAPLLANILEISVEVEDGGDAVSPEEVLEEIAAPAASPGSARVVANEATNTLLIRSSRAEYQRILGVLHRLDVPPRQVLVEATIVEVSLNEELRFGTQVLFDGSDRFQLTDGLDPTSIAPSLPGFNAVFDVGGDVIISALEDITEINVVSSPNLMIINNQSARLVVGDQVPVSVQTAQEAVEDPDIFVSTVEFRETGVIFEVTPRINSSGSVILDINQEVSTIGATDASTGNPIISERSISSSIAVDSGETIALGGLFEKSDSRGTSGFPILHRAPIIGGLFGTKSRAAGQTELLVLITPRIVNDRSDARRVTRTLRDRVENIRLDDASLTRASIPTLSTSPTAAAAVSASGRVAPVAPPSRATPPAVPLQAQPAAPSGRSYIVHLGAFGTEAAARARWSSLMQAHTSRMNGLTPKFTPVRDLFGVSVGPLPEDQAAAICRTIQNDCSYVTAR
ncbi:MAG: type II secretion system secretin GspD [Pseudomonadota bacterium]